MKRPAFQFYPNDWSSDLNLRRCSPAARGVWMDVLCALHNSDDGYGFVRWPLKELARTIGASMTHLRELIEKGVLRGSDTAIDEPLIYRPRHGRKLGDPVTLVEAQKGPFWYSKRLVKDEYIRTVRGESTRFGADDGDSPKGAPKTPFGDGSSSSSSSSPTGTKEPTPDGVGGDRPSADAPALALVESRKQGPPACPHIEILALWAEVLPALPQHEPEQWRGARADHLRARWRETAASKRWQSVDEGMTYFRRLFAYVGQSAFLTGRVTPREANRRPFTVTLAWLVKPENWAKTIEGEYHPEAA